MALISLAQFQSQPYFQNLPLDGSDLSSLVPKFATRWHRPFKLSSKNWHLMVLSLSQFQKLPLDGAYLSCLVPKIATRWHLSFNLSSKICPQMALMSLAQFQNLPADGTDLSSLVAKFATRWHCLYLSSKNCQQMALSVLLSSKNCQQVVLISFAQFQKDPSAISGINFTIWVNDRQQKHQQALEA